MSGMSWWLSPIEMIDEGLRLQQAHEAWVLPAAHERLGAAVSRLGLNGRYELIGLLNRGGQAFLWAARDRADEERMVVVKTVSPLTDDPVADRRLTREARLLRHLAGEATIMPLLDWGPAHLRGEPAQGEFETERPWLVLPYRPHLSLDRAVALNGGPLRADAVWRIGRDIAAGLAHMHARGVVHRDLSLRNVLLTPTGCVLADLGMAWSQAIVDEGIEQRLTTGLTRQSRGVTWGWLAPEAAQPPTGDRRPDREPAADVFCWGLHVYCALAGHHPWDGRRFGVDDQQGIEMYELRRPADLAPLERADLPRELADAVRAALDGDPDGRPSAAELLAAVGDVPPSQAAGVAEVAGLRYELQTTAAFLAIERARRVEPGPPADGDRRDVGGQPPEEAAARPAGAPDTTRRHGTRLGQTLLAASLVVALGMLGTQAFTDLRKTQDVDTMIADAELLQGGHVLLADLSREAGVNHSSRSNKELRAATNRDAAALSTLLSASGVDQDRAAGGGAATDRYTTAIATLANARQRADATSGPADYWRAGYDHQIDALRNLLAVVQGRFEEVPAGDWIDPIRRDRLVTDAQVALYTSAGPLQERPVRNALNSFELNSSEMDSLITAFTPFQSSVQELRPPAGAPTVNTYASLEQESEQLRRFLDDDVAGSPVTHSAKALTGTIDQAFGDLSDYQRSDMGASIDNARQVRHRAVIRLAADCALSALLIALAVLVAVLRRRRQPGRTNLAALSPIPAAPTPVPPAPASESAPDVHQPALATQAAASDSFLAAGDPEGTVTEAPHPAGR